MRIIDVAATIGAWSWFGATLAVFEPVLRVAGLIGDSCFEKTTALMCHSCCWSISTGMCNLQVEGQENIPRGQRVIIVGNHQSLVESFFPFWYLADMRPKYVAKRALARWVPTVSYVLRRGGNCLIDRSDRAGALEAITGLGRRVAAGEVSAVIFPEGTRSTVGQLNKFKYAGLRALLEAAPQATILPMVLHGGDQVYPKGRPRVRAGSLVRVRFLPPIERNLQNLAELAEVDELIEKVHTQLQEAFTEMQTSADKNVC